LNNSTQTKPTTVVDLKNVTLVNGPAALSHKEIKGISQLDLLYYPKICGVMIYKQRLP
jgi:hypothetical protein